MPSARSMRCHLFIILVLILCASCMTGCPAEQGMGNADEVREYIVNQRTRKIHAPECPSVEQMSEKNKREVSDTLISLLKQDYVICRRCRAGINETGVDDLINHILHRNLYGDDIPVTATQEDYLKAIEEVSEWYVDHVPTYASKIQEEPYSECTGQYHNYKTVSLRNKGRVKSYIVLTSDTGAESTYNLSPDSQILRGSEKAAKNYSNCFRHINFERQIAYYPCDILSADSDYNTPGDDCVRYMFTIFNRMDSHFTQKFHTLTKSGYSKTNSRMIAADYEDVAYGFTQLGFKIYDSTEREINVGRGNYASGYVFRIDSGFQLQKGDILARDGHVHIYLGNGTVLGAENFGWGRVYRSFPQIYDIEPVKINGSYCISLKNSSGEKEYYRRVYRYIGRSGGNVK